MKVGPQLTWVHSPEREGTSPQQVLDPHIGLRNISRNCAFLTTNSSLGYKLSYKKLELNQNRLAHTVACSDQPNQTSSKSLHFLDNWFFTEMMAPKIMTPKPRTVNFLFLGPHFCDFLEIHKFYGSAGQKKLLNELGLSN